MGAATRRRGHGTAAEVVASVNVTVPTAVGDVAHVNICPLLACQSRAPLIATALFKSFVLGHHRSSNKTALAQPDESWIPSSLSLERDK